MYYSIYKFNLEFYQPNNKMFSLPIDKNGKSYLDDYLLNLFERQLTTFSSKNELIVDSKIPIVNQAESLVEQYLNKFVKIRGKLCELYSVYIEFYYASFNHNKYLGVLSGGFIIYGGDKSLTLNNMGEAISAYKEYSENNPIPELKFIMSEIGHILYFNIIHTNNYGFINDIIKTVNEVTNNNPFTEHKMPKNPITFYNPYGEEGAISRSLGVFMPYTISGCNGFETIGGRSICNNRKSCGTCYICPEKF